MTTTQESGRHVTPERIRADGANVERAGFRLVYECPLAFLEEDPRDGDCPTMNWRAAPGEEIEDRLLVESGFLERLCDQADGDQRHTENWRKVLRSL